MFSFSSFNYRAYPSVTTPPTFWDYYLVHIHLPFSVSAPRINSECVENTSSKTECTDVSTPTEGNLTCEGLTGFGLDVLLLLLFNYISFNWISSSEINRVFILPVQCVKKGFQSIHRMTVSVPGHTYHRASATSKFSVGGAGVKISQ